MIAFMSELMMPLMMFSLKFIIEYLQDDDAPYWEGLILVGIFCAFSFINIYLRHVALFQAYSYILVVRKSSIGLLYSKILKLSQKSLAKATSGKIINLASGDLSSLERTLHFSPYIIISPLIFIVSIIEVAILVSMAHILDRMVHVHCGWISGLLLFLTDVPECTTRQNALICFQSHGCETQGDKRAH